MDAGSGSDNLGGTTAGARATLVDWLLAEGRRQVDICPFTEAFGERLVAHGLPVWRLFFGLPVLHPLVRFLSVYWHHDRRRASLVERAHGTELLPGYRDSPVASILDHNAEALRFRLEVPADGPLPHPILDEVRDDGGTDYVMMRLAFNDGRPGVVSMATRRGGGFSTAELALFDGVRDAVAAVIEAMILKRLARTVLGTYVGRRTGARVLSGEIRRGSLESMTAVLWYCDLRGFTPLSDRLAPADLIALLNGYFEIMHGAVETHGGEVLKFIGDGVLAVFPLSEPAGQGVVGQGVVGQGVVVGENSAAMVAAAALEAARQALRDMDARNAERTAWGEPTLRCGIALHLGEVLYGNIGAPGRLDFTVIGPAVNLATRIEGLCKRLDRAVLTSDALAAASAEPLQSLGWHPVKGLTKPVEVFGLAEQSPADTRG